MKLFLAIALLILAGCCSHSGHALRVHNYKEALAIVKKRPEIIEQLDYVANLKDKGVYIEFEDGGYSGKGSDVCLPNAWIIYLMGNEPERRYVNMVLYVSRKDGRVYVDGGLEPPVPLEQHAKWLDRWDQPEPDDLKPVP
jgi:hypothetical protein